MAQNNTTPPAGGTTPWGRIAGVAILASGVVALTVVAINNESGTDRLADQTAQSETRQTSAQTAPQESTPEPDNALAQADLSQPTISEDLTRRLTSTDAREAAEAIAEFEALQGRAPTKEDALGTRPNTDRVQAAPVDLNPNANIEFESLVYDFGTIHSTREIPGEFVFTSTGTEPLTIQQVRPACGCTSANAAELRNSVWQPGEGSVIKFSYRPDQTAGIQSKTITVTTNSASNRTVTLTLRANYVPSIKLSTQTVNFGRIEAGSIGQFRVVIEARDPAMQFQDFDLGEFADDFDWEFSALESVDENFPARGQLLIRTKAGARTGPFSRIVGQLMVLTREGDEDAAEAREQSFNVVLMGEIVGQVEVEPRLARTPLAEPGSDFEHSVLVKSRRDVPFKILDVKFAEGDATDFAYEVQPVENSNGTQHRLIIRGKAPNRTGGYMGRIDIITDIPNHGATPFQFSGVLRAASPIRN